MYGELSAFFGIANIQKKPTLQYVYLLPNINVFFSYKDVIIALEGLKLFNLNFFFCHTNYCLFI